VSLYGDFQAISTRCASNKQENAFRGKLQEQARRKFFRKIAGYLVMVLD
jgi:hypothetical protein